MQSQLVKGDPLAPCDTDLIYQEVSLPMGKEPKPCNSRDRATSWRILTGNSRTKLWARVAYRYEAGEST